MGDDGGLETAVYPNLESLEGAVVGVEEQHGEGAQLGGPVPPVAAVDDHTRLVVLNL